MRTIKLQFAVSAIFSLIVLPLGIASAFHPVLLARLTILPFVIVGYLAPFVCLLVLNGQLLAAYPEVRMSLWHQDSLMRKGFPSWGYHLIPFFSTPVLILVAAFIRELALAHVRQFNTTRPWIIFALAGLLHGGYVVSAFVSLNAKLLDPASFFPRPIPILFNRYTQAMEELKAWYEKSAERLQFVYPKQWVVVAFVEGNKIDVVAVGETKVLAVRSLDHLVEYAAVDGARPFPICVGCPTTDSRPRTRSWRTLLMATYDARHEGPRAVQPKD